MSRKQPKRRAGNMVFSAIAGIFVLAVVCGVGFGVASADSTDDIALAGAFGFDAATTSATTHHGKQETPALQEFQGEYHEQSVLASTSQRTIDSGMKMIDAREEEERRRIEAEAAAQREREEADNKAALERVVAGKAMQGVVASIQEELAKSAQREILEYDLPAVDWSVGRESFVQEWGARIDAYLDGSALAGMGGVFADAAWENGVDPRWSPAISSTESGKGAVCFAPFNAWGWGEGGWSDWETAIRAHVAGLAQGYGYSITPEAAATYCPPNSAFWYANTISQMDSI